MVLVIHGGVNKAVCCHPYQHDQYWNAVFQWEGITEIDACVGDLWAIGSAKFEVAETGEIAPGDPISLVERPHPLCGSTAPPSICGVSS